MSFLGVNLPSRPRSGSGSSDTRPLRKSKNPQPVFQFTDHIESLKEKYSGRDGKGEQKPYIPEHELKQYWTKSRVLEVCKSHDLTIKPEVVSQRCLRLFSVVVYIDQVQCFNQLLERGISDTKLPLADADIPQRLRAPAFKDAIDGLLSHQWIFCPLILDYALLTDLPLQTNHILPFREQEKVADGDAAQIHRILVSGDCNKLDEDTEMAEDRVYILKTYTEKYFRPLYLNEVKALTTLRQARSENIVGYYGSFVQNGTFNLLLQFADGGSLLDYYGNTQPPREPADVQRFWRSLFAVFKGLHAVHRIAPRTTEIGEYRGIHQDIKPDNIILKKGPSGSPYDFCPLLADFGHSHFRVSKPEDGEVDAEMGIDRQGNQTYGAPECSRYAAYLRNLPGPIPTAADIFSTGCVPSDAASWVAFGPKGRHMYRDLRAEAGKVVPSFEDPGHWDCFHDAIKRSAAVDDMHNRIRVDCGTRCDRVTPNVLDLVENDMLLWDWRQRKEARLLLEHFVKSISSPETPELEVEEQDMENRAPSRRDRFKVKVRSIIASPTTSIFQDPPSTPISDAPTIARSTGGEVLSSVNNNDAAQLLGPLPSDTHPHASPSLPPRPVLEPTESSKRSSRTPNINLNSLGLSGFRNRSTSRHRTDSPQISSTTATEPEYPDQNSLSLEISPIQLRPHTPVGGLAGMRYYFGSSPLAKTDLTLQEALDWRAAWKAYGQAPTSNFTTIPGTSATTINLSPDTHELIRSLHRTLWGRDHIFVVDTSRSMRQHKADVERAFIALGYLVKRHDLNKGAGEVWLVLGPQEGGSTPTVYHNTKTTKLLAELENCRYDRIEGLMEDEFADLLRDEIIPRLPSSVFSSQRDGGDTAGSVTSGGGKGKDKPPSPLSVIVLTDGQWGGGPDGAGLQNPIRRLIETVKERRLKRTQIMVQFIRFGDNADGIRHLRALVAFGRANECDIIDTRRISGNVCEMLIGSLSEGRDMNNG